MGKPTICISKNKGADQVRSNCEADQHLCFRYTDSTIPLLSKYRYRIKFISVKVVKMNGLFRFKRRKMLPYCLGLGFAMGLGHEKQEWRKERSSDWYDMIVQISNRWKTSE